jgi:hypothetical protein
MNKGDPDYCGPPFLFLASGILRAQNPAASPFGQVLTGLFAHSILTLGRVFSLHLTFILVINQP